MTNRRRNPGANQRPPSMALVIHILVQWITLLNILGHTIFYFKDISLYILEIDQL